MGSFVQRKNVTVSYEHPKNVFFCSFKCALLTSFEHEVPLHSLQAEGLDSPAHHGVPHSALVAVDVHQAVVTRDLKNTGNIVGVTLTGFTTSALYACLTFW